MKVHCLLSTALRLSAIRHKLASKFKLIRRPAVSVYGRNLRTGYSP